MKHLTDVSVLALLLRILERGHAIAVCHRGRSRFGTRSCWEDNRSRDRPWPAMDTGRGIRETGASESDEILTGRDDSRGGAIDVPQQDDAAFGDA